MKKTTFLICLSVCCFAGNAQLLWEISGNGMAKPSYLFGTMHVNDSRVFTTSERAMKYFEQCSVLAGELKFDQGLNMEMMNHLFMPGDTTLTDLLKGEAYTYVKNLLSNKLGSMASFSERMKPIFISILLTDTEMLQSARLPLDLYLQEEAKEKNIEVVGLETFQDQIKAFNSIPLQLQADMLYNDLKDIEENGDITDDLIQLYTSENLDSLHKVSYETYGEDLGKILLTNRNEKMATKVGEMVRVQKVFVAIGAAHLPGKDGVIERLRQQGFSVKPIQ